MKLNQSRITENVLRFMQSNQTKEFTASTITTQFHSTDEVSPELVKMYSSVLNSFAAKKNLTKKFNAAPHLYPDAYYLEDFQFQYWIRKGFQV